MRHFVRARSAGLPRRGRAYPETMGRVGRQVTDPSVDGRLLDDAVQVWWIDLSPDPAAVTGAWRRLSDEERSVAGDLKGPLDRDRKVRTRAALREILARALDLEPRAISIGVGAEGKPEVSRSDRPGWPHFNVSHSGSRAVIAVSGSSEVGVDVEVVRELDWRDVAQRFFSPGEIVAVETTDPTRQLDAFFDCWVRKEAYVKGLGVGLRRPTTDFSVPLAPDGGRVDDAGSGDGGTWRVRPVDLGPEWRAALAVVGGDVRVTVREWSDQPG
jgi:4'-phosphopantetheinyl transferase